MPQRFAFDAGSLVDKPLLAETWTDRPLSAAALPRSPERDGADVLPRSEISGRGVRSRRGILMMEIIFFLPFHVFRHLFIYVKG